MAILSSSAWARHSLSGTGKVRGAVDNVPEPEQTAPCMLTPVITDANGVVLFRVRNKLLSLMKTLVAEDENGNEIFRVRQKWSCESSICVKIGAKNRVWRRVTGRPCRR